MNTKKAGLKMSLLMGGSMSAALSLIGMVSSGHFTVPGFISSFLISFAISLLLGAVIPIRRISDSLTGKLALPRGCLKARLLDAMVSDLAYTPLMTLIMVYIAWRQAVSHGAAIPFLPMFLKSLIISLIAAFMLIFLLTPAFMKIAFGNKAPH